MFNNKIYRNTQSYLDKILKKYDLSSGSYPYLMELEKNEGTSQIYISRKIGNDRAMSARTINRLIESDFIYRVQDEKDCRAYKLYLTPKFQYYQCCVILFIIEPPHMSKISYEVAVKHD